MAVIDVHTHMMSSVWVEAIGKDETYGLTEVNGKRMIALGGRPYMPVEDEMLDYDRRIKDMDAAGVDLAIISLTTPSVYWADQAEAARLSRTVNDEMADRQRAFPDRLRFFATLPWQYPEEAVMELVRTLELQTQLTTTRRVNGLVGSTIDLARWRRFSPGVKLG